MATTKKAKVTGKATPKGGKPAVALAVKSQAAKIKYSKAATITVLTKGNPHRAGICATQFTSWVHGKVRTVAAYLASGGTQRRLNRIVGMGAVKVS